MAGLYNQPGERHEENLFMWESWNRRPRLGQPGSSRAQIAHKKRSELPVQMGRNARFETSLVPVVIPLDHLSNFMQPGNHAGTVVGHDQFHKLANRAKLTPQFCQQSRDALAAGGANRDPMGMPLEETGLDVARAIELIDFIEHHQGGLSFGANFFQNCVDSLNLFLGLRMAGIDNVDQEISLNNLFQGRFESFHETVW